MKNNTGLMRHIISCTDHDATNFYPFLIEGARVGSIRKDMKEKLLELDGFLFEEDHITLRPDDNSCTGRTDALSEAAAFFSLYHHVDLVGEIYPVFEKWNDAPFAKIDRAAIPWFGTLGFGVHLNGYVKKDDDLYIWVARRAADRKIDPGKLDNIVGGGLPIGLTPQENLAKESWEEAGIPQALAEKATAQGSLSYQIDMMKGVRNDVLFIFDMEMPESFMPENTDGEVENFTLMPAHEVLGIIEKTDRFKFNCNLVIIDFLMRHNIIGCDHPEYGEIEKALSPIRAGKAIRS